MPGMRSTIRLVFAFAALLGSLLLAQQTPANPPAIAPHARLMAARTIYIEHNGGSIPNDVIGDAFQGWGRYQLTNEPEKADLIVSINAPVSETGVSVGGSGGRHNNVASSTQITRIRLVILDARDRVVLWSGGEQPKSSLKEKQREDNEVEASLRLFRRFRTVIEPEPAPQPQP
jgi:hypothetical protein